VIKGVYKTEKRRFWEEHISKWKTSGVSQVEYCRQNGLNIKSFRYWKRRIGRLGGAPALVELPFSKSVPVCSSPPHPHLCLIVGRHYRVEIGRGFDSEDLERVIRALGRI
jgi:hypothetical protein